MRLDAKVSDQVKPGVLYTTFHFPELLVNRITGDVSDQESLCPEYKVVSVDFAKCDSDVTDEEREAGVLTESAV